PSMPPIRLLVINADDLGFAPGVNRGILEARRGNGVVGVDDGRRAGVRRPALPRHRTAGRIALQGASHVRDRLLATLDNLPLGVTELMMHPGNDDAVLAEQDPYRSEREAEVKALLEPEVSKAWRRGTCAW
ncbi:MAG: hypothetical protein JF589_04135, partial [Gemmatimonadetes bacterium]|nr:hypothetical protein [Gemmatimonadota bacterium]